MVTAADINAPLEALADRTAVLVPDVQVFTPTGAPATWTVPEYALWVEILMVGGGGGGGGITSGTTQGLSAGGGGAGATVRRVLPAASIVALTIDPGAGGHAGDLDTPATDGIQSTVYVDGDPTLALLVADGGRHGGGGGDNAGAGGGGGAATWSADYSGGDGGSAGTVGINGDPGEPGPFYGYGLGGSGPGVPGLGGPGYGGGGGGAAAGSSGAGGGAGGYGLVRLAGDGTGVGFKVGGDGAPGVVVITTWRGVPA